MRGLELVPSKWRPLVPPTSPAARDLRRVTPTVGQRKLSKVIQGKE
jgi:hypothetical protein